MNMNMNKIVSNLKIQEKKMNRREKMWKQVHSGIPIESTPTPNPVPISTGGITFIMPPPKTPNSPVIKYPIISPIVSPNNMSFHIPVVSMRQTVSEGQEKEDLNPERIYINVYQPVYKFGFLATGIGDFIRGTYFMIQYCEMHSYKYDVIINHPVSMFLKNMRIDNVFEKYPDISLEVYKNIVKNVEKFDQSNFVATILPNKTILARNESFLFASLWKRYLSKKNSFENKSFIYTISYPMVHIPIREEHRLFVQHVMEGTEEVMKEVDSIIENSQLEKGNYTLIHLRCGDRYLIPNYKQSNHLSSWKETKNVLFSRIKEELKKVYDPSSKYFFMADNNTIKREIINVFPFIKVHFNEIAHMGEGIKSSDTSLKNNIIDFHLIANSSKVISYSVYEHGSGFSKWCAETYNIPYTCIYLK